MDMLTSLLETNGLSPALPEDVAPGLAQRLGEVAELEVYPRSIVAWEGMVFFLGRRGQTKWLGLVYRERSAEVARFSGEERAIELEQPLTFRLCPTDHANAVSLRRTLPFTAPRPVGVRKSFGFGDRLGLATPGHVRALRRALCSAGGYVLPVFAQQSIREMERSGRTPQQVLDDAMWGVFQEGWRDGFGADADHLKTIADVDACVEAGYTMYTVDPGDYVDNAAATADRDELLRRMEALPWDVLESSPQQLRDFYVGKTFVLGTGVVLCLSEESLLRAAVKYGRAVAHTATMYRHLVERMGEEGSFELEMSVDETETPTTPEEHFFVASELKRLGVQWVSLAPRFVGRFEKGVDYIGNLRQFETEFAQHVAIARTMGPYKLSIHSGSDKFSIYPVVSRLAGELLHLKTAGTSYLEALRALSRINPEFFREILTFARQRYPMDRATYHVSADLSKVPAAEQFSDEGLTSVLETFDGRQVLHVTFGSVLTAKDAHGGYRFRERLLEALQAHEEVYYDALERHLDRHVEPFVKGEC